MALMKPETMAKVKICDDVGGTSPVHKSTSCTVNCGKLHVQPKPVVYKPGFNEPGHRAHEGPRGTQNLRKKITGYGSLQCLLDP